MGSGKGSTTQSTVQIPADVLARYNSVNQTAQQAASRPFVPYSGEFVAPINAQEQTGIANTNAAAGSYQPYFNQAQGYVTAGGQAVNPTDLDSASINKYMSPYLNTVLGSESALLNQNNQQQQSGQLGTAIQNGAFGGDRGGIAAANLAQQQNLANANIYSNILNQGYNNALGVAQQQQGVGLAAGQANRAAAAQTGLNLAGLGTAAQQAGLTGAAAQTSAGQLQQQTQQGQDTAQYQQFLQSQSYPFQVAQFLAGIAEGTGSLSGSTTTTNSSQNGIFSDRRLKTSVHKVGKTFDGQDIYTYKYKGHPETHMGLMAQDVEDTHPDAVGLASGYKTVDYRKATDDAAKRGHFAGGGGAYDPSNWQEMLGAYQQMYAPLLGAKGGLGAGSIVPETPGQSHTLAVAQTPAPKQDSLLHDASSLAGDVDAIGKAGDKFGAWSYGHKGSDPFDDSDANNGLGDTYARGGLASGGNPDDMPYGGDHGLDIPDDQQKFTLNAAKPANAPNSNPLGDLKDIASIASTIAAFARGGRAKRADGGATDAFSGSNGKPPPFPTKRADGGATNAPNISAIRRALMIALNPMLQHQGPPPVTDDAANDDSGNDSEPQRMVANGAPAGLAAEPIETASGSNGKPPPFPKPGHLDPQVVSFLKSKGLGDDQAQGIAAGIYAESANNPNAVNPKSGALGLGQWLGARKKHLVDQYGDNPDKGEQLNYLWHELNGGDRGGSSVLSADDAPTALAAYIKHFMRPAQGAETTGDLVRGLGALRQGFADGGAPDPDQAAANFDLPDLDTPDDTGLATGKRPKDLLPSNFSEPVNDLDQSRGLASAPIPEAQAEQPRNTNGDDTHGNFWHNLKHGSADAIVPLLTGIGAFGTANTKNPLTALATGLGAGASEYQKMREFELEPQQLGINRMQAISSIYNAQNQAANNALQIAKGMYDYRPTNPDRPWFNMRTGQAETNAQHDATLSAAQKNIYSRQIPGLPPLLPNEIGETPATGAPSPQPDLGTGTVTPEDVAQSNAALEPTPSATPAAAPSAHPALASTTPPLHAALPHNTSANARAQNGEYNGQAIQNAIPPIDDSNVPVQNRISTLQANYEQQRAAGNVQAANAIQQQIQAINSGHQVVLDNNGQQFQGYAQHQRAIDAANATYEAKIAQRNQDVVGAQKFVGDEYPATMNALKTMATNSALHNMNRGTESWADLAGQLRSIPGVGDAFNGLAGLQGASDEQKKLAVTQALQQSGLSGAPATALREALLTVASPGIDPSAKYAILTRSMASLQRQYDYSKDLLANHNNVVDTATYQNDWNSEPRHSFDNYVSHARKQTPYAAGMTPQQMNEQPRPGVAPDTSKWGFNHAFPNPQNPQQVLYWDPIRKGGSPVPLTPPKGYGG
jgi:hypothetical protein